MTGAGECAQVAGANQKRGTEVGAETGHGLNDRSLRVLGERLLDLGVNGLQTLVEGENAAGELGDDAGREVLAGKHDRLGLGGGDRAYGNLGRTAHVPASQPGG